MTRRLARTAALIAWYIALDLLEAAAYFAAVALATALLGLLLPLGVALTIALLTATVPLAYIHTRRAGRSHRDL